MSSAAQHIQQEQELSSLSKDIIRTLIYSNIFQYPLSAKEIWMNTAVAEVSLQEVRMTLEELISQRLIFQSADFYFLPHQDNGIVQRRIEGNALAHKHLSIAFRMSRFIASFPFVRGICLSGSLSKGFMDKESDIDYFIVTQPGRLWITRTLLILFKKIFLLNSKKYFCMNYFVDTDHLLIPDKNIFTAKELYSLIPTYSKETHHRILLENGWARDYFPNFTYMPNPQVIERSGILKSGIEKLFSGKLTNALDTFCMRGTERFWNYKFRKQMKGISSIRCQKSVSKFHPKSFEPKILQNFRQDIAEFEITYKVNLQA